ncbi:MAG: DUF4169 family protein [Parvibaculum sp.]|nr:DUF4169 family protein [Parvibaculum sp.]
MVSEDEKVIKIAQFRKIARDDKKERTRREKEAQAAANRVRFGRTGAEKKRDRALKDKAAKAHDGLRREVSPDLTPLRPAPPLRSIKPDEPKD